MHTFLFIKISKRDKKNNKLVKNNNKINETSTLQKYINNEKISILQSNIEIDSKSVQDIILSIFSIASEV
jgi:hypothetical protein